MRPVVGVMGSGRTIDAGARVTAHRLGAMIASRGWVLLTGGGASGVMDAASEGAHSTGGLVIGVLRGNDDVGASAHLDVAIRTGMGDARNAINVLSSDVVVALPGGPGTVSEVALALKSGKTVIVLGWDPGAALRAPGPGRLIDAASVEDAVRFAADVLGGSSSIH